MRLLQSGLALASSHAARASGQRSSRGSTRAWAGNHLRPAPAIECGQWLIARALSISRGVLHFLPQVYAAFQAIHARQHDMPGNNA